MQILARDRLLGSYKVQINTHAKHNWLSHGYNTHKHKQYTQVAHDCLCLQVKPVIKLLKQTLVGTGALLVTSVFLFIFASPVEDFIQNTFATKASTPNVPASNISSKFNLRYVYKHHQISKPKAYIYSCYFRF